MKRSEFLKDTEKRLRGRREAMRRALAGDMSMLRAEEEQSVGDEIDAAIATSKPNSARRC